MKLTRLTHLAFEVNAAIDDGKIKLTYDEMKKTLQDGKLFERLKKYPTDFDEGLWEAQDFAFVNQSLQDLALAVSKSQDERKLGVEKNGLCILLAYIVET